MINFNALFNEYTLNIFTDVSVKTGIDKTVYTCSGSICTIKDKIIKTNTRILKNSTNNLGEITAILLGIEDAFLYRNKFKTINLFSDSKINVFGLREWIFSWVNSSYRGVLYSSAGKEVANQNIILTIINFILVNNLNINLYHQNGHVNINSMKDLMEARSNFNKFNGIRNEVDMNIIKQISFFNNYIDNHTRLILNDYDIKNIPESKLAIKMVYKPFDINNYKTLININ
jgi:ribonuclease HI